MQYQYRKHFHMSIISHMLYIVEYCHIFQAIQLLEYIAISYQFVIIVIHIYIGTCRPTESCFIIFIFKDA